MSLDHPSSSEKKPNEEATAAAKKMMPEKRPGFLQDFSKSHFPNERKETAREIRASRHEKRALSERELRIGEIRNSLHALKDQLNGYDSFYRRVVDFRTYSKLRAQLGETQSNLTRVESEAIPNTFREPAASIQRFNERMAKYWETAPYSKEEAVKYFDAANLAKLSVPEYGLLLKRFPSSMVTHVTRQGIRDHTGGVGHTAGRGAFWDGFEQIAKKKKLENHISLAVSDIHNKELIAEFLRPRPGVRKEEALAYLHQLTDVDKQHRDGSLADLLSIHTATEEVADAHYGAESENEIFFAYPSMYVASQKKFQGQLRSHEGGTHNNNWIIVDEEGLPTDAGLVFIPADAQVSPKTGSRYELSADKQPIREIEGHAKIRGLLDNPDFLKFLEAAEKILGQRADEITPDDLERLNIEGKRFVSDQPYLTKLFDNYACVFGLSVAAKTSDEFSKGQSIWDNLSSAGLSFKHAENSISSKQYWEEYFTAHPESRPSKVVYYDGGDPTKALRGWKEKHGLVKGAADQDMGFSENSVTLIDSVKHPPDLQSRLSRFRSLGEDVIEDFYAVNRK